MAKRLKAGAASKEPGLLFVSRSRDVLALVITVTDLYTLFRRLLRLSTSGRRWECSVSSRAYSDGVDA